MGSEVQVLPGPPCLGPVWGRSSAGRAPALQAGGRRFDPVRLHQGVETTGRIIAEGIPIGSSRLCEARLRRHGFVVSGISIVLCQCEEVGAFLDVPLFGLSDPYG